MDADRRRSAETPSAHAEVRPPGDSRSNGGRGSAEPGAGSGTAHREVRPPNEPASSPWWPTRPARPKGAGHPPQRPNEEGSAQADGCPNEDGRVKKAERRRRRAGTRRRRMISPQSTRRARRSDEALASFATGRKTNGPSHRGGLQDRPVPKERATTEAASAPSV